MAILTLDLGKFKSVACLYEPASQSAQFETLNTFLSSIRFVCCVYVAAHLQPQATTCKLKVVEEDGSEQDVTIPAAAFHLFIDILTQMAQGNAITLIPIHAELTTQEAADILNVSRPFLIKLLESDQILFHKVGRHRRVRYQDLMDYKEDLDSKRMSALDELAAQAQELEMGY